MFHNKTPKVFCSTFGVHYTFEPHLFYFLDLSQEETCCVLIPAGTIISNETDEEIVSATL
jgi:hypothetical protein